MLKEFKHFKSLLKSDNHDDYFLAVIPFLNYVHFKHKDCVFHHSDRGGIIYFILKGSAAIFIPKSPEELEREVFLQN